MPANRAAIAKNLGLTCAAVSYALRELPGVNEQTRRRTLRGAKRLGRLAAAIALTFVVAAAPAGALARTWVVAQKHLKADDANAGTEDAPLKTINAAARKAEPGDTVLVHGGIYREHVVYLWLMAATRAWEKAYREGKCNAVQSAFWRPKPAEELYDTDADPWEVHNLIDDPAHQDRRAQMRQAVFDWMREIRDTGVMPEPMLVERATDSTAFDLMRSDAFAYDRVLETADRATRRDPAQLSLILERLADPEPALPVLGGRRVCRAGQGGRPSLAGAAGNPP